MCRVQYSQRPVPVPSRLVQVVDLSFRLAVDKVVLRVSLVKCMSVLVVVVRGMVIIVDKIHNLQPSVSQDRNCGTTYLSGYMTELALLEFCLLLKHTCLAEDCCA